MGKASSEWAVELMVQNIFEQRADYIDDLLRSVLILTYLALLKT